MYMYIVYTPYDETNQPTSQVKWEGRITYDPGCATDFGGYGRGALHAPSVANTCSATYVPLYAATSHQSDQSEHEWDQVAQTSSS